MLYISVATRCWCCWKTQKLNVRYDFMILTKTFQALLNNRHIQHRTNYISTRFLLIALQASLINTEFGRKLSLIAYFNNT